MDTPEAERSGAASRSLIELLAGAELSSVVFVMDYIQLVFQPSESGGRFGSLTTYTSPWLVGQDGDILRPESLGYRDGLVDLLRHVVKRSSESAAELRIDFDDGRAVLVSLTVEDSVDVEAAILQLEHPTEWDVWRPGDIAAR